MSGFRRLSPVRRPTRYTETTAGAARLDCLVRPDQDRLSDHRLDEPPIVAMRATTSSRLGNAAIDGRGRVRHVHFGEGDCDGSEAVIRELLAEPAPV